MKRLSITPVWPMRRKNFHVASLTKYLVGGALLFLLLAWSVPVVTVNGQQSGGTTWTLKEIRIFNNLNGNKAMITSQRYDATGGSVDINVSGNVYGSCPGGYEKLRFTWRFASNVTQVVNGSTVSASLEAGQVSRSQNCGEGLAGLSGIIVNPSSGITSPFSGSQEYQLIDIERFKPGNKLYAKAANGPRSAVGNVTASSNPPNGQRYAYFSVTIAVPSDQANSELLYVYLYENSGGGGNPPTEPIEVQVMTNWAARYAWFGRPISGTFGTNPAWSQQWALSWMRFNLANGGWTSVYLATNKANPADRWIKYYNPNQGTWSGWLQP